MPMPRPQNTQGHYSNDRIIKVGMMSLFMLAALVLLMLTTFRSIHNGSAVLARASALSYVTRLSTTNEGFFQGTFYPVAPVDPVTQVEMKGCIYAYRYNETVHTGRRGSRYWAQDSKALLLKKSPPYLDIYRIHSSLLEDIEDKYVIPYPIGGPTTIYMHDDTYVYPTGSNDLTYGNQRWSYHCVSAPENTITTLGRLGKYGTENIIVPLIPEAIRHNYIHMIQPGRVDPETFVKNGKHENDRALYYSPIIWLVGYWFLYAIYYAAMDVASFLRPFGMAFASTGISWVSFYALPHFLVFVACFNLALGVAALFGYPAYLKKQQPRTLIKG